MAAPDAIIDELQNDLDARAAIGERAMPGISEVANGSAAWSSELVDLVTEMRGLSEGQEPVVELQGRSASVEASLRDRPFHENAGVEVSAG